MKKILFFLERRKHAFFKFIFILKEKKNNDHFNFLTKKKKKPQVPIKKKPC